MNPAPPENIVPIEHNPFIKSAFGKLFNRYHEKKSHEKEDNPILKSVKTQEYSEKESDGKSPLMLRSQIFKNFKVKDTMIQKDWLKNKANTYDVILLNAFYLVDIKRNLLKTKVN